MNFPFKGWVSAIVGATCVAASATAAATPVTYTVFAVTDVRLGGHFYPNAQVSLKFNGDTDNVAALPATAKVKGRWITQGDASLEIVSAGHRVRAHFQPNQLVISVDLDNGGVGFGAFFGSTFTPAYPLAIDGSNVLAFNGAGISEPDLVTPGAWADHAWSCIGFPVSSGNGGNGQCTDPAAYPLLTDRGEFFIYQPYLGSLSAGLMTDDYEGSVNTGVFSVFPGVQSE